MFVKYANVVEVARNSKIEIKHYGKTNCVSYGGMSGGKHQFKILSATPNVKGIEKFVGIIHELSHVLFQSPFTATRNLLQDNWGLEGERYKLFFNAFNVLEDQRIESQMGKMYLKHAGRFTKTTKKLGTLMSMDDIMKTNPVNMLLAIRFHRGDDMVGLKDYDVYDKALKDVVLTDKYGALRVLVSIKPYIDAWITDKENKIKNADNSYQTDESKAEMSELDDDTARTNIIHTQNSKESSGEDSFAEAPDDLKDTSDMSDKEIDDMINQSKDKGKNIVGDIFSSLRDDGNYKKLPKNLKMINRYESNYDIDYKVSKGMSRIFKILMMRSKEFIDYDGEEVDVESYVEGIIRGNDMGRCRVNQKTSHGVSIVISIDGSSSMQGEPIETARNLVATMFESVKNIDNVEVRANVWGGNTYGFIGMTEINTMNDVKYINLRSHQGNYMTTPIHMALDYSSSMLKQMKGSKKMMILITDGVPNHFNAGYHIAMNTYMISCKKSLVKAMNVTSNIMCIVVQSDMAFKRNPIRVLFNGTKIMNVHTMKNASEKVIKQFKRMVMNSLV
jgi:uncharacterized protein YegL